MRNKYFSLQLKRVAKHYPSILLINIILIVCIAFSCVLIINKSADDDSKQKIKVGIVGDLTNTYLDVGISAIQNLDSSRFSVELIPLETEDSAKDMVIDGKLIGYIRIPDGFVNSVIKMDNIPIAFVTHSGPSGFGSILTSDVANTISETITETQKGIYGMRKLAKENGKTKNLSKLTDLLNIKYIYSVLNRSSNYTTDYVGMGDGLSMGGYFVCGGIMMFLLLWGISCSSVLLKKDRSMEKLLISKGQSVFSQVFSEYFVFFIITLVTFLLFATAAGIILQYIQIGINELDYQYVSYYLTYIIKLIPVFLMITALQFLFYEIVSGTVGVILLQFVFALGTGYICGCLYPSFYFPVSVQKIAAVLPTGVGLTYMRQSLSSNLTTKTLLFASAYFLLFFGLAVTARKLRTSGDEK